MSFLRFTPIGFAFLCATRVMPLGAQLLNDDFTNATPVSGLSWFVSGSNVNTSVEAGEPQVYETLTTVWYTWQAPTGGVANLYTDGSDFDTVLSVFTGTVLSQLVCVASNDDENGNYTTSFVNFQVGEGVQYSIQVGGYYNATGGIKLSLICAGACVTNDTCAQAMSLEGSHGKISGSSSNATIELSEPHTTGDYGGHSVWYKWVAPLDGDWAFTTDGSLFDTFLGIYTGNDISNLTAIVFNDDMYPNDERSMARFSAVANVEYLIQVDGYNREFGSYELQWGMVPCNNNIGQAGILAEAGGSVCENNVAASRESIELTGSGMRSIWYRWSAPSTGLWTFNTQLSDFDTWLGVYSGTSISNLTLLASSDDVGAANDTSSVVISATNGIDYFIAVDGVGRVLFDDSLDYTAGNVRLNWFPFAPQILQSSIQSNEFGLSFWTTYGTNYIAERTLVLTNDHWDVVTNCIGSGVIMPVLDRHSTNTQGFYRLRIE